MSRRSVPRSSLLDISSYLYRALLALYPRAFRHAFGPHMAQVFRDCCRQAQRERGAVGILSLWVQVLSDLAVTAFHERLSEGSHMSRSTIVRLAGAAALLGGALNLLVSLSHPHGLARAAVPGSIVCLIIGMLGLHVLLWRREGRLGMLGFVLVGIGLVLGLIGMAGSAVGIVYPNPAAPFINTGEHAGLVFIGCGMLFWGIVTLRVKALGRWSFLPLVMGLLSLTGIVFLIPAAFSALETSIVPEIFAASWIFLGYALLTRRNDALPTPPQPVAG